MKRSYWVTVAPGLTLTATRDDEATKIALDRVGDGFPREGVRVATWEIYNTDDADRVIVRSGFQGQAFLLAGDTTFALPLEDAKAFANALGFTYEVEP